jgi:hypothetical protein
MLRARASVPDGTQVPSHPIACRAERGHDRDVGGVAPARHQNGADARLVVAGIKRVPAVAEVDFEPGAEIHWRGVARYADVAEITGAVARRDVDASAQRDSKVGEIPAHAAPLGVGVPGRLCRARVLVTELYAIVDIVADRLNQRPPLGDIAEPGPCDFCVPATGTRRRCRPR